MADYEIVIRDQTKKETDNPVAGGDTEESANSTQESDNSSSGKALLKKIVAVGTVAAFADQIITHDIQTVTLRTGSEEQQQRLSFTYSVGKKIAGAAASVAMGAAFGGLPGALMGLAVSAAHTAITYAQKAEDLNTERRLESVGLGYMNIRAGGSVASFSGSRLRTQ